MRIKCFDLGTKLGVALVQSLATGVAELPYYELLRPWGTGKGEIKDWRRWNVSRATFARLLSHEAVCTTCDGSGWVDCPNETTVWCHECRDANGDLRRSQTCERVYYEMPMGVKKNRAAERVLTGLELALEETCGKLGIGCIGVSQPTIKKFATCHDQAGCAHETKSKNRRSTCSGDGSAKKPEMMAAATRIWGVVFGSDDVADAACLAAYAAVQNGMKLPDRVVTA